MLLIRQGSNFFFFGALYCSGLRFNALLGSPRYKASIGESGPASSLVEEVSLGGLISKVIQAQANIYSRKKKLEKTKCDRSCRICSIGRKRLLCLSLNKFWV